MPRSLAATLAVMNSVFKDTSVSNINGKLSAKLPALYLTASEFTIAWRCWKTRRLLSQHGAPLNPVEVETNERLIEDFIKIIQSHCLNFPHYSDTTSQSTLTHLNRVIMHIPWGYFSEEIAQHRLRVLFDQQAFRLQFGLQYIAEYSQCLLDTPNLIGMFSNNVAAVLLEYPDIRAEFLKLPEAELFPIIKAEGMIELIIRHSPTFFSELSDTFNNSLYQNHPVLTGSILSLINNHHPQEMQRLLGNALTRRFLRENPPLLTDLLLANPGVFEEYSRGIFAPVEQVTKRDHKFDEALSSIALERFAEIPLMPGMCLLAQERDAKQGGKRKFYELPGALNRIATFVQQIYDYYFHSPSATSAHIGLQLLEPITKEANIDSAARTQANYFAASIHMDRAERTLALPYLNSLEHAGDELNPEQHGNVVLFQLLCHNHNKPFENAETHLAHLPAEESHVLGVFCNEQKQIFHNGQINRLKDILINLNQEFDGYLKNRDTLGFFYTIGIKNAALSQKKNAMVTQLRQFFDGYLSRLESIETLDELDSLTKNLSSLLAHADQINTQYIRQHSRSIDGIGTLRKDLRKAEETVLNFSSSLHKEHNFAPIRQSVR